MACTNNCPITLTAQLRNGGCDLNTAGGVMELYIAQRCDVASITTGTSSVVTAITMESGKTFTTFQQNPNVANITTTANSGDLVPTTYTTNVNLKFYKLDSAKRLNFMALAQGETIVIVRLVSGELILVGEQYFTKLSAGTINSGTNMAEPGTYDVTLTELSSYAPKHVTSGIIDGIVDSYAL